jgi:hypothetical protein
MKNLLAFILCLYSFSVFGQDATYSVLIKQAEELYDSKQYAASAQAYAKAFQADSDVGTLNDRYNAACSWALAGEPDIALAQLQRIAKAGYSNYAHLAVDADLASLHGDARWPALLETVRQNKARSEVGMDTALIRRLEYIYQTDQAGRQRLDSLGKAYGWNSPQVTALWADIGRQDSLNLIEVSRILDTRGWLGRDVIGPQGSTTLFLVVQHSDSATQAKYLPMMRAAVTAKKASGSQLALLEDRVLLGQGKKQIYGSQVGQIPETGAHYVQPLEDPDRVDERRVAVGLGPLSAYVARWGIKWDVEQYKKDLPELMKRERMK